MKVITNVVENHFGGQRNREVASPSTDGNDISVTVLLEQSDYIEAVYWTLLAFLNNYLSNEELDGFLRQRFIDDTLFVPKKVANYYRSIPAAYLAKIKFYLRHIDYLENPSNVSQQEAKILEYFYLISRFYVEVCERYDDYPLSNVLHFLDASRQDQQEILHHFEDYFLSDFM